MVKANKEQKDAQDKAQNKVEGKKRRQSSKGMSPQQFATAHALGELG